MEIKATDLRIGNLVKWGEHISPVYAIYSDNLMAGKVTTQPYVILKPPIGIQHLNKIEPIPITNELLLKAGLEKSGNGDCYFMIIQEPSRDNGLFVMFYLYDHSFAIGQFNHFSHQFGEAKYIHQLQNLFHAFTGEELIFTEV